MGFTTFVSATTQWRGLLHPSLCGCSHTLASWPAHHGRQLSKANNSSLAPDHTTSEVLEAQKPHHGYNMEACWSQKDSFQAASTAEKDAEAYNPTCLLLLVALHHIDVYKLYQESLPSSCPRPPGVEQTAWPSSCPHLMGLYASGSTGAKCSANRGLQVLPVPGRPNRQHLLSRRFDGHLEALSRYPSQEQEQKECYEVWPWQ